MTVEAISLASSLAALWHVDLVVLCTRGLTDEVEEAAVLAAAVGAEPWTFTALSPTGLNLDTTSPSLLLCSPDNDSVVAVDLFRSPVHWLNEETAVLASLNDLPLRLDGSFFTFTVENETRTLRINEWYKVKQGPPIYGNYGEQTGKGQLRISSKDLWERRKDFKGAVITNSVLTWSPFMIYGEDDVPRGAFNEIISLLAVEFNFTIAWQRPKDGKWGSRGADGTGAWNGVMGELVRREVDLCTGGLNAVQERMAAVDFTEEVLRDKLTLVWFDPTLRPTPPPSVDASAYLSVLTTKAWCMLISAILVIAVVGALAEENLHMFNSLATLKQVARQAARATMTLVQISYDTCDDKPFSLASKVRFMTTAFMGFVAYAAWSADLTAQMSVPSPTTAPDTFKKALDAGYVILCSASTGGDTYLASASPTSGAALAYAAMKKHGWRLANDNGIAPVNRLEREAKTLYFGNKIYEPDTTVVEVAGFRDSVPATSTFALSKGSELTAALSYGIGKLKQGGVVARTLDK